MLESDCNAEFYYVGKISHMRSGAAGCCSEAWFSNGFIHREPWKHLYRRYVRSTECLLVVVMIIGSKRIKQTESK